jgi:hypothetical protein
MSLGSADEQKPSAEGTVEAMGVDPQIILLGLVRHQKGLRGRFGMYVPPVLEALRLAGVEQNSKDKRMRAH